MMCNILRPVAVACGLFAFGAAHAACPFNVSGDATADSLRDGVLLVRYAQGMRGAALVAGTTATTPAVENFIVANTAALDINGNGVFDTDDAAIIARNVFGFSSAAWLPGGKAGNYASRLSLPTIKAFVDAGCAAPAISAATQSQIDASRFLIQSTFGSNRSSIAEFMALPGADHAARTSNWISNQFGLTRPKTHFQYSLDRKAEYDAVAATFGSEMSRETFWTQALKNPDQLRQRTAFALSELLVMSANGGTGSPFDLAAYLDLLADNGFGNYRDLLYKVALSPAMGSYLSHLRNDGGSTNPNENFAREILQLFSVGLFKLDVNGDKIDAQGVDANGVRISPYIGPPIASYDENTVKGFAKVFTGLTIDDPYCKTGDPGYGIAVASCIDKYSDKHPSWSWSPDRNDLICTAADPLPCTSFPPVLSGFARPMVPYPGKHSKLAKQMLQYNYTGAVASCTAAVARASTGGLLPALTVAPAPNPDLPGIDEVTGLAVTTGTKTNRTQAYFSINQAIDNIFCHPNVGPFVSKHLIRAFVSSTPSSAYVGRVAARFNNNGSGVRGDMQAVLRAVLTDAEATPTGALDPMKFGKLKEPILRLSAIYRSFDGTASSGRYRIDGLDSVEYSISQGPLQSPTVFNYFHPEFSPPGPVANNNGFAPEFEITTTTAIAATQNYFGGLVANTTSTLPYKQGGLGYSTNCNTSSAPQDCIFSDLSELYTIQADSSLLFDYLNLVLMGGSMSATNKTLMASALDAVTAFPVCTWPAAQPPFPVCSSQTAWQDRKRDRVKAALWLTVHSPEFQIQR